jgi:hypothetical protein
MTAALPVRVLLAIAGLIPAIIIVLFAGVIGFIALTLDTGRRRYALDLVERFTALASVLIGGNQLARPGRVSTARGVKKTLPE